MTRPVRMLRRGRLGLGLAFVTLSILVAPAVASAASTQLVSVNGAGAAASSLPTNTATPIVNENPAVDASGRYVAFESASANLFPGGTNPLGIEAVWVRDRVLDTTQLASIDASGFAVGVPDSSQRVALSADGQTVAFVSADASGTSQVWVRDMVAGTTTCASLSSTGAAGDFGSGSPSISADGRYVAFASDADNLVAGDGNGTTDVFVRDLDASTTVRASVSSAGVEGDKPSDSPAISADGQHVAFASWAQDLVPGDTNAAKDVFVRDLVGGTTIRASVSGGGTQGNDSSFAPSISSDGRYVAFDSAASNLVAGDTNGSNDIFVRDTVGATTERDNVDSAGSQGDAPLDIECGGPSISADGRYVAFGSCSDNLVPGDANGCRDVFLHDRNTGSTQCLSQSDGGVLGDYGSGGWGVVPAAVDANGSCVAFGSDADNIAVGAANNGIYVRDFSITPTPPPSSGSVVGTLTAQGSGKPIANAMVSVQGGVATTTAADGSWRISGVGAGPQTIAVTEYDGWRGQTFVGSSWTTRPVSVSGAGTQTLSFTMPVFTGDVAGTITASGGAPLSGAAVALYRDGHYLTDYSVVTTADGTYLLRAPAPLLGVAWLLVSKPGYASQVATVAIVGGSTAHFGVQLQAFSQLGAVGSIAGRITKWDAGGGGLAGAIVTVPGGPSTMTAGDGSYTLGEVTAGVEPVEVSLPGYTTVRDPSAPSSSLATVTVSAGGTVEYDTPMQPLGTLWPGMQTTFVADELTDLPPAEFPTTQTLTVENGPSVRMSGGNIDPVAQEVLYGYEFQVLPPGNYGVAFVAPGFRTQPMGPVPSAWGVGPRGLFTTGTWASAMWLSGASVAGTVTPSVGTSSTPFTYSATWTDGDDDAPTTATVVVDGVRHNMAYVSGGYATGAAYSYATTLPVGAHNYHFDFGNSYTSTRSPDAGEASDPTVQSPDTTPPVTTLHSTPASNAAGWNTSDVTVTLDATDGPSGSGVAHTFYALDSVPATYAAPFLVSGDGTHTVTYWSTDVAGNAETHKSATIKIDESPLQLSIPATLPSYFVVASVEVSASDLVSGITSLSCNIDGHGWYSTSGQPIWAWTTITGPHEIQEWAQNAAGTTATRTVDFSVDIVTDAGETTPTLTIHTLPSANGAGWNDTPVTAGVNATPAYTIPPWWQLTDSGRFYYAFVDSVQAVEASSTGATTTVSAEGVHALDFSVLDNVPGRWQLADRYYTTYPTPPPTVNTGIVYDATTTVRIDLTPPSLALDAVAHYTTSATVDASATDALSGLSRVDMRLENGSWVATTSVTTTTVGPHTVFARAFDIAGNERETSATFTISPAYVTTSLGRPSLSPKTPKKGKTTTFSATISPPDAWTHAATLLRLYHQETKTVTKIVGRKKRRVKVLYWHLRTTLTMRGSASGKLTASTKLGYSGKWQMQAVYAGAGSYLGCQSATVGFSVK